jgi:uncharacterized protein (TIGR00369 family)
MLSATSSAERIIAIKGRIRFPSGAPVPFAGRLTGPSRGNELLRAYSATMSEPHSGLFLASRPDELSPIDDSLEAAIRERMQAIPIFHVLGFSNVRIGAGWLESTVARNPQYDGIFDSFHGGMLMTAADSAAAIVSLTLWGPQSRITTTDMNIRFLAPARSDVKLFAQAVKRGRTLIPSIANFWRDDGTLVAVAQITYMRVT